MGALAKPKLTVEEYLALDLAAEHKSEFYRGEIFAMSGGSPQHARIIGNLHGELYVRLKGLPCQVFPSDLRVQAGELLTYPDVSVVCEEPRYDERENRSLLNPVFLAEVLSPSTEAHDRGLKFVHYHTIPALREHALISQGEPRVEVYTRQAEGKWLLSEFTGLDAVCEFVSLGINLPLADLFDKVDFMRG